MYVLVGKFVCWSHGFVSHAHPLVFGNGIAQIRLHVGVKKLNAGNTYKAVCSDLEKCLENDFH